MEARSPKPPSARTAMAMAKAQAYQDAADAPSTLRAYASDVKNFEAWCVRHSMVALPATPEVVGAYLAAAGEGYAMQTLRGIGRTHGSRGRRSAALTTAELKRLTQACDLGLPGLRDQLNVDQQPSPDAVCLGREANEAGLSRRF